MEQLWSQARLGELGWLSPERRKLQGALEPLPVPKGAPREMKRAFGIGHGETRQVGMASHSHGGGLD